MRSGVEQGVVLATLRTLAVDRVTAEVVGAFREAGVPSILLKGPSVALWLYPRGAGRPYVDSDLLVPPEAWTMAEEVLSSRGFDNLFAGTTIDERDPGACPWRRTHDRAAVDLHRRLRGVDVADDECWRLLQAHRESMSVGGIAVDVLAPAARTLNLVLHAAHDGIGNQRSVHDLARGLEIIPPTLWSEALALGVQLKVQASFAAGLRLLPSGRVLADRLHLPISNSVDVRLHAMSPPPLAMGFAALHERRGFGRKLGFLKRNFVPTPAYMRYLSPLARRGVLGMAAAYVGRWLILVRYAVPSYRAWRRIFREARSVDSP
jgi:hypothetical protein